ncbi:replication initiation protein [Polaribacter sp. MSW13]|uniref:Replication initiation protein n=1 Tax=Polaribacter marinus TaxID=2916838 RepID=A0A9X2AI76_9FLAO|nr:replication initiation protein [Polaribacter marinus]MCI2228296.1 replication initiation protein [Polaribacter marinus]
MKTIINHPNHIIYASFNKELTSLDENIIFHILNQIKHINHFEEFKEYKSEKIQLKFKYLNINRNYKSIESTLKKLSNTSIDYSKNIPKHEKIERTITNFISGYRKTENKREVIIEIPGFTVEFLTYLKGGYSKLDFKHFISLKSIYSKRIYKLLIQFSDKGGFNISESKFRKIIGIENKYLRTSDLRKKINLVNKELKNKCEVEFNYKINKQKTNCYLSFKIINTNNSVALERNYQNKIRGNRDMFIFNFLKVFLSSNDSNQPQLITEQIIDSGNSEQFYNRVKRLKNELSTNNSKKTKNDVTNLLISTILPEYKVKINKSS